jgi:xanthine/CO dehydrogenase XdhC/CoxF family maturation factor
VSRPEELPDEMFVGKDLVAVLMNHNYNMDRDILARLLIAPCAYIGILGPRHRTDRMLEQLLEDAGGSAAADLANVYAPAGLDIGASTPEAIALSIIAEIQAVTARREGGFLRRRTAPIYDR